MRARRDFGLLLVESVFAPRDGDGNARLSNFMEALVKIKPYREFSSRRK